jgi:hypothetical protein
MVSPTGALDIWTGRQRAASRPSLPPGRLTLHTVPFVPQDDYDRLLWSSR